MDQYVSTYRKDYLWPHVKIFQQPGTSRRIPCTCGAEPGGNIPSKEYVGLAGGGSYEWSQLGPMSPLLDPKLYSAKPGPIPESESTTFDQPDTYLKKVPIIYFVKILMIRISILDSPLILMHSVKTLMVTAGSLRENF